MLVASAVASNCLPPDEMRCAVCPWVWPNAGMARIPGATSAYVRSPLAYNAAVRHFSVGGGCVLTRSRSNSQLDLLRPRVLQLHAGGDEPAFAFRGDRVHQGARRVAHFLLEGLVTIECLVAGRIGLVVADIPVKLRSRAGRYHVHVARP